MLVGKKIILRLAEKADVSQLQQWLNDVKFAGDYQNFPVQTSYAQLEKRVTEQKNYENEWVDFIIEKKDGTRIGWATHYISAPNFGWTEIGFAIIPNARNRGYGTEAAKILVDYLFLTREIVRIQAVVDARNAASRLVVEKAGFRKEGTLRSSLWNANGEWADGHIYSILREDWEEPKILAKHFKRGLRRK
jgi:RimJ/RimL family protein N-acetyltransferase